MTSLNFIDPRQQPTLRNNTNRYPVGTLQIPYRYPTDTDRRGGHVIHLLAEIIVSLSIIKNAARSLFITGITGRPVKYIGAIMFTSEFRLSHT